MADIKAPGLNWRTRQDGRRVAYWVAAHDYVKRGYQPSTVRIYFDPEDPGYASHIATRCHQLQEEMVRWSEDAPRALARWDGTLAGLVTLYQTDPDSPFQDLRVSQATYAKHLRLLCGRIGETYIEDINGLDVRRWYKNMAATTSKSYAYLTISILKAVLSYGASLGEEFKTIATLRQQVSAARFQNGSPRKTRMTYTQACSFRASAHAAGRPSMALGIALQYEGAFRQRDVVGEWLIDESADAVIRHGKRVWRDGLTWSDIDRDGVLRRVVSKTRFTSAAEVVLRTCDYPDLASELARVPIENRVGPIVINERTGLPYMGEQYRATFRRIARAAGIPDSVWSMDARAGAVTETYEAGATTEGAMALAGHTQPSTSRKYMREKIEQSSAVARLRVGGRTNGKQKT